MTDIKTLQERIKSLEKENQYLQSLLIRAGIPYESLEIISPKDLYDLDQGARIIPRDITSEDANRFFSMFWGRTDVYSKRTIKKSTGEANYYTQCWNFWKNGCPRTHGSKVKCQECGSQAYKKLEKQQIIEHLRGEAEDGTDVIGVYPLLPDDTCRFMVFDFDHHERGAEKQDFANQDNNWREEVDSLRQICEINGIDALVERSRSGKGAHLWISFKSRLQLPWYENLGMHY